MNARARGARAPACAGERTDADTFSAAPPHIPGVRWPWVRACAHVQACLRAVLHASPRACTARAVPRLTSPSCPPARLAARQLRIPAGTLAAGGAYVVAMSAGPANDPSAAAEATYPITVGMQVAGRRDCAMSARREHVMGHPNAPVSQTATLLFRCRSHSDRARCLPGRCARRRPKPRGNTGASEHIRSRCRLWWRGWRAGESGRWVAGRRCCLTPRRRPIRTSTRACRRFESTPLSIRHQHRRGAALARSPCSWDYVCS